MIVLKEDAGLSTCSKPQRDDVGIVRPRHGKTDDVLEARWRGLIESTIRNITAPGKRESGHSFQIAFPYYSSSGAPHPPHTQAVSPGSS